MKPWALVFADYGSIWIEDSFNTYEEATNYYKNNKVHIPSYYKCSIFHIHDNLVSHVVEDEEE